MNAGLIKTLATLLTVFIASAAQAQTCTVRVNAQDIVIDPAVYGSGTATRRERALAWPTARLNRLRGETPACTSDVTLAFVGQLGNIPDTDGFCLQTGDADSGYLLLPGARNFRGRCTRTTCDRVNDASGDVASLGLKIADVIAGPPAPDLSTLQHASGALLLSGPRAVVRSSLQAAAGTALSAALSSPPALAASALTVIGVGSAVYVCSAGSED